MIIISNFCFYNIFFNTFLTLYNWYVFIIITIKHFFIYKLIIYYIFNKYKNKMKWTFIFLQGL